MSKMIAFYEENRHCLASSSRIFHEEWAMVGDNTTNYLLPIRDSAEFVRSWPVVQMN